MTWLRCVLALILCIGGRRLDAQEEKRDASLTLEQAVDQQGKRIGALQDEFPALIRTALAEKNDSTLALAAKALLAQHDRFLMAEIEHGRLCTLHFLLGKAATGKKTREVWLAEAEKSAAPLPKPPPALLLPDFSAVDRYALAAPLELQTSAPKLGAYLGKAGKTDLEKARAVFVWMVNNLAYDRDSFFAGKWESNVDTVLKTRRGVCGGLSKTYEALGRFAGLKVWAIPGHARAIDAPASRRPYAFLNPLGVAYLEHGWNAIKIGEKVYIVDPTFGGGLKFEQGKLAQTVPVNPYYFLVSPEAAIATFVPADPRWQFLPSPIKKTDHQLWPVVRPAYFALDWRLESHPYPVASTDRQLSLVLHTPADTALVASISTKDTEQRTWPVFVQRRGNRAYLRTGFPGPGQYPLLIGIDPRQKPDEQRRRFHPVVEYRLVAKASAPETPKPYDLFREKGYLYYPLHRQLPAGKAQTFAVSIAAAKDAMLLQADKTKATLQRVGQDLFVGEAMLSPGPVRLFARFDDSTRYHGLLEFMAE